MNILTRYALREVKRSFNFRKKYGRGQYDFAWMSLFILVWLTAFLMLYGAKKGVLNRFLDVSVGYVKNHGVPIWLNSSFTSGQGLIPADLKRMQSESYEYAIYPFSQVDSGMLKFMDLNRDKPIWKKIENGYNFLVWAIQDYDPIWQELKSRHPELRYEAENGFPAINIILSKKNFELHFDCDSYRNSLKEALPASLVGEYSQENAIKVQDCLKNKILLELRTGAYYEPVLFNIIWEDRLPLTDEVTAIIPYSLLVYSQYSKIDLEYAFFPELSPESPERYNQLLLDTSDPSIYIDRSTDIQSFVKCLGVELNDDSDYIDLGAKGFPSFYVNRCAEQADIKINIQNRPPVDDEILATVTDYSFPSPPFKVLANGYISRPCDSYPIGSNSFLEQADNNMCLYDVVKSLGGFTNAYAYSMKEQMDDLITKTANLKKLNGEKLFYINRVYEQTLNRFGFINRVFALLQNPLAIIFIVVSILFWGIITGLVISNRRHRFGVYMAKGISAKMIYYITTLQIFTCFFLASLIAIILNQFVIRILMNRIFSNMLISSGLGEKLRIVDFDIIPMSFFDYMMVISSFAFLLFFISIIFLWINKIRKFTPLSRLLNT